MPMPLPSALLFLIQDGAAPAQGAPAGGGAPGQPPGLVEGLFGSMLFPLLLCFGVFWFLILRPESKQRKKRLEMLSKLAKGDKVLTNGGLYGTVVQVQENVVTLQVDEGVRMKFALSAVQALVDDAAPAEPAKK
jgi:preprotein translocase subunit YajC